ncbi:hypothetical protein BGZ72_003553, partial [Mortierella alpina]
MGLFLKSSNSTGRECTQLNPSSPFEKGFYESSMDLLRTTHEKSNAPVSGSVSNVTELKQGADLIKKGDEYRDR